MTKILGLDLGTNSIGWAVVEQEIKKKKETFKLKEKGVVIFSEGVGRNTKGNEISRAAQRTMYRAVRRLKFRIKLRKYETLLVLAKNGMCPLSVEEIENWAGFGKERFKNFPTNKEFLYWLATDNQGKKDSKEDQLLRKSAVKNPYYFRDKAIREKLNKLDLGRALYHIAQRRGFLSNRLDQSDKDIVEHHKPNLFDIIKKSKTTTELTLAFDEYFKNENIINFKLKKAKGLDDGGDKMYKLYASFKKTLKEKEDLEIVKETIKESLNKKDTFGKVKQGISNLDEKIKDGKFKTLGQYFYTIYGKSNERIRGQYTAREDHYIEEFNQICKVQELGEINEEETEINKKYKGIALNLYKAIFFQRPLKSQKGVVGKCTLEPTKYRCPVSRPEFEEFRMYQYINNFKIKTPEDEKLRILTPDEKDKIKPLFFRKKMSFDFEDVVKKLIPKHETAVYFKSKEAKTAKYVVNYKLNTSLSNCPTIFHFRNIFGNDWKRTLNETYSDKHIRNRKTKQIIREKTQEEIIADIWHVWATFTDVNKLKSFAKSKLNLSEKEAEKFSKVTLKKGYASLSLKAINKILPFLKEDYLIYSHAVFMGNMKSVVDEKIWNTRKGYIQEKIKEIIDKHQVENNLMYAINTYINKNDESYNSEEADAIYRKELNQEFEQLFGKNKWKELNVANLFENQYQLFVEKFNRKENFKIKRLSEKIIDFLEGKNENGEIFSKDKKELKKLYHPSDIEKFKTIKIKNKTGEEVEVLGSPLSNSIKNPMAMKALHKVRNLINTLILEEKINKDTKIHIELARELNDANKRAAIQKWQEEKEDEYKVYRKKIQELYKPDFEPTSDDLEKFKMALEQREDQKIVSIEDISKYKLWEEQRHICLYTGKTISLSGFLNKNPDYDIEHTIPRSVSLDNSQMNKTLCEKEFNRKVKKNQIPFELGETRHADIMNRISHWKDEYEKLNAQIKKLVYRASKATTKESKDKFIQERHYLKLKYNYWKGKYDNFKLEEVKSGFKNSQMVDTGIITKYARQYLKSYFNKVYTVKGIMVDQFKKEWGIKKTIIDKDGVEKKDRTNHIHHCEDAITIACMTKHKYDVLAQAWALEEKEKYNTKKKTDKLTKHKPWKNFTQDVLNIHKEVLIVHSHKDKVPIQSKKKLRIRGKIQYRATYKKDVNGKYLRDKNNKKIIENYHYLKDIHQNKIPVLGKKDLNNPDFILHSFLDKHSNKIKCEVLKPTSKIVKTSKTKTIEYRKYVLRNNTKEILYQREPVYLQGDTVRGSLHEQNTIGCIVQPKFENEKPISVKGKFILEKDKEGNLVKYFVKRKPITKDFSIKDVEKIVDLGIRKRIKKHGLKNVKTKEGFILLPKEVKGINGCKKDLKEMLIKKVRMFEKNNPLEIKEQPLINKQTDKAQRKKHKHIIYFQNDKNYCMAIYEEATNSEKKKRSFELINNLDFSKSLKGTNGYYPLNKKITHNKKEYLLPIMNRNNKDIVLKRGGLVILYDKKEIDFSSERILKSTNILERFYKIISLSIQRIGKNEYGIIKLKLHNEARKEDEINKNDFKPDGSFKLGEIKPIRKMNHNQFNALIDGIDFKISPTGKIIKI